MRSDLELQSHPKRIEDILHLWERGDLDLRPPFQRLSVWKDRDRRKLIESILEGYPLPSIFLYRLERDGRNRYEVIDGQQRLETILRFVRAPRFGRCGFDVRMQEEDEVRRLTWRDLERSGESARFRAYQLQVIEVSGSIASITDLFIRLNSTGKSLTTAERNHAKYFQGPVLKQAHALARRFARTLDELGVVTRYQADRMKDVELMSELLISVAQQQLLHRKSAVDAALGNDSVSRASLRRAAGELAAALKAVQRVFPGLVTTRFHRPPEFYNLCYLVWDWHRRGLVLTHRDRNATAAGLLEKFSTGVDAVRDAQSQRQPIAPEHELYLEYHQSVQRSTDQLPNRELRHAILSELFAGLFERKDDQRLFSELQRRLLWHTAAERTCAECGDELTWKNFQADHVLAHSRGGRTRADNAALLCRFCNASKGSRDRARRRGRAVRSRRRRAA